MRDGQIHTDRKRSLLMRIQDTKLGGKIVLDVDDFIHGFATQPAVASTRILGKGGSFLKNFNPYTVVPGVAYPGQSPTNLTNVSAVDIVQVDCTPDFAGSKAYTIGGNAKVHEITLSTNTINNSPFFTITATGAHSAHTGIVGQSVAMYKVGTAGTKKLFYSWYDNTDWDVGVHDLASTGDPDFMSTVALTPLGTVAADLTNGQGKLHPLFVSSDDRLYMGSGNHVHMYNANAGGANDGTFYSQYLVLPVGYQVVGFAETQYDLVVFATSIPLAGTPYRARAKAFFFGADRQIGFYKDVTIDDDDISCPFSYKGTVGCFSRTRHNSRSVMRLYNGSTFESVFKWSGNLPTLGGFEQWNDLACFQSDGLVYAVGSYDSELPNGKIQIASGSGSTSGFLKSLVGGVLYTSSGTSTLGGLDRLPASYNSDSFFQSLTAFPDVGAGKICKFKNAQFVAIPGTSGGRQLDIQIVNDAGTTITLWSAYTNGSGKQKTFFDYAGAVIPNFFSLKFILVWQNGASTGSPGIVRVEVEFEIADYSD